MRLLSLCLSPAIVAAFLFSLSNASAITISPTNPTVTEGVSQQFTSSVAATWKTSCGSVSSGGLFQAPLYPGHCTVTATASSGIASTVVTIVSPIVMTPTAAQTPQGQQQQFTASIPVDWTARCGSITSTGLYTASAPVGTYCTIEGIALSGTKYTVYGYDKYTVYGYDKILSPPTTTFTVTPTQATVTEGATEQFVSSAAAGWSTSCGTMAGVGLYQAPLLTESCTITATATSGGQTASALADIVSPITITPVSATTSPLGTQQFTANIAVSWTSSCGSINAAGLFTAPGTAGACTILATASSGIQYTAQATDTVIATVGALNYLTWKNDNGRTGLQPQETVLTPANVSSTKFAISWIVQSDGAVWGQPLYMAGLPVGGETHNVLFATTSNDSVYALDADTGTQLWKKSFLSSGVTAVVGSTVESYMPQIGIVGTPVIDANSDTIYVVAMTNENGGTSFIHRLHALDATTGNERAGSPIVIADPQFVDTKQMQRPGLLLANGMVYVSFGSFGDHTPYSGFVFAYNENSLAETAVFNDTQSEGQAGIWMAGAAPSADADGNIYVATGNGSWDGKTNFGDSVIKLSPALQVLDYFTPYNQAALSTSDLDLGSSGVLLVPEQTGTFPYEAIMCGKPSSVFVLNTQQMGEMGQTTNNIIQQVNGQVGIAGRETCLSIPAFWNQQVYFGANGDVLKMFTLDASTGMLSSTPVSQGSYLYSYPGAQPVISANGNSNGIVWTFDRASGTLRANDATDVSKVLFISPYLDYGVTWDIPTVVNGHVYLGLVHKIVAFSLK